MAEFLTWPYRVRIMVLTWAGEPALVVAVLFIAFVAFTAWRRGSTVTIIRKHLLADRIFIILLMVAAIPFVFLPNSPGKQYLLPAVPYVLAQLRGAVSAWRKELWSVGKCSFSSHMAVAVLALQAGRFVVEAAHHLNPSLWTVTEVHDLSVLIARHVKEGAVATLYPTLVLDAGSPIYPQFATGVFSSALEIIWRQSGCWS